MPSAGHNCSRHPSPILSRMRLHAHQKRKYLGSHGSTPESLQFASATLRRTILKLKIGDPQVPDSSASFRKLAAPLLACEAFTRLRQITFLGILSPAYRDLPRFHKTKFTEHPDGSRADHSIGVAHIFLTMADALCLSVEARRYAVAWALTHDLASWPLSHTGDAAFEPLANIRSRQLRKAMIEGAYWLPKRLTVFDELKGMRIEPSLLLALMGNDRTAINGDLIPLWKLIHCPINPDTIEGMTRSGLVFGINVPRTENLVSALYKDLFSEIMVERSKSVDIIRFWRMKASIYKKHINHDKNIEFESAWSRAIASTFSGRHLTISDTLEISERELIRETLNHRLPRFERIQRYKPPLQYLTSQDLTHKKRLRECTKLDDLNKLLIKKERHI